jgi:hypothetical protein
MLFKSLALFIYLFGSWFTTNFIFNFVLCIICLAFDFWTVKNVSGRLLVGLRWWSYVRDDGSNEWVFESLEDMTGLSQQLFPEIAHMFLISLTCLEIGAFDANIFWTTLYGFPVAWAALLVLGVLRLKFEYLPVILAALSMNGANLIGYYKCSGDAQNKMKNLLAKGSMLRGAAGVAKGMTSGIGTWLLGTVMSAAVPSGNTNRDNAGVGHMGRTVVV